MTIPVHVALVDDTGTIPAGDLARVAGALNEQVQADFAPVWHVRASVGAYPPRVRAFARGTWAIRVQQKLDERGALGYHADEHNQPYALVELTEDWTVTASHELLEMLADPFGSRLHGARIPEGLEDRWQEIGLAHDHSHVRYLLEVCDPCERSTYEAGGVAVSDFLLPAWYRTNPPALPAYSHTGFLGAPREVRDGGYVSFLGPGETWWQVFNEGGTLSLSNIGTFDRARSQEEAYTLREFTDAAARRYRA